MPAQSLIKSGLIDICVNSDVEVIFDITRFFVTGLDDSVKSALALLAVSGLVPKAPATEHSQQVSVKIELANEHKEFVSGKKNGKLNKIMGQSEWRLVWSAVMDATNELAHRQRTYLI